MKFCSLKGIQINHRGLLLAFKLPFIPQILKLLCKIDPFLIPFVIDNEIDITMCTIYRILNSGLMLKTDYSGEKTQ